MKVAGEHTFDAPPEVVWEGLLDPEILAATMPGCDKLEKVGEDQYEGVLNMKVGPVQGRFQGKIQLEEIDPPNGYVMLVDGQGAPGFVKATATIAIAPDGGKTRLTYDGDAQVGGRIAGVGQRLLESSAKAVIRQSLEGLNENLKARAASAAGAEEPPPVIRGPSQTELAAKVAGQVARDLVPKPVLVAVVVLVVLLILFFLLR